MTIKVRNLHSWNVTYKQAVEVQKRLCSQLILKPLKNPVRFIGGCDVSYSKKSQRLFAAVVILDIESMEVAEGAFETGEGGFPYIPGLLSFREIPVLLKTLQKLKSKPDVFILDGQGIAHPQGLGLASHLGILIDLPTVGCAKSKLVGEYKPFPKRRGRATYLYFNRKKVGAVVCTKDEVNPVFVSPGHRIDIPSSIKVILKSCKGFRLPEPIRKAHSLANRLRENDAF